MASRETSTGGNVTIYKGSQAKIVNASDLSFWLSAGWSTTRPDLPGGPPSIEDTTRVSTPGGGDPRHPGDADDIDGFSSSSPGVIQGHETIITIYGQPITYAQLASEFPGVFPAPGSPGMLTLGEFYREFPPSRLNSLAESLAELWGLGPYGPSIGGGGSGGGRGGGGGASGPTYVKPDERLVRDAIEARSVALIGTKREAQIEKWVNAYMDAHKRAFDLREKEQLDPMQDVMELIEGTAEYKTIHRLRPDSMEAMDWISSREGALLRAGVSAQFADDQAITQAILGSSEQVAGAAGETGEFARLNKSLPGFFQSMQASARAALRLA